MATVPLLNRVGSLWRPLDPDWRHHLRLSLARFTALGVILPVAFFGIPYYRLDLADRPDSAFHALLRPSGSIGLRLGMLGVLLFLLLYLYPLRKQWPWLATKGKTRHWLDFHVLFGITAPLVITLHSSFKTAGVAGVAYWIMVAVALSGFVGRYIYQQIPRKVSAAELTLKELSELLEQCKDALDAQFLFAPEEVAELLKLPSQERVDRMPLIAVLAYMAWVDLRRPFQIARLRRRRLPFWQKIATLGGLAATHRAEEQTLAAARRLAWLSAKLVFLQRVQAIFHLWHVVHRPFSYSFAVLAAMHIGMVLLLGYY